jgi:hypothetical protein
MSHCKEVKDRFDYAYKGLLDSYNKYMDYVYKTIGSIVIIGGVIGSSEKAREFLQQKLPVRLALLIATALAILTLGRCMWDYYRESRTLADLLKSIDYLEGSYYECYRVKKRRALSNTLLILSIYAVLFTIILNLGPMH